MEISQRWYGCGYLFDAVSATCRSEDCRKISGGSLYRISAIVRRRYKGQRTGVRLTWCSVRASSRTIVSARCADYRIGALLLTQEHRDFICRKGSFNEEIKEVGRPLIRVDACMTRLPVALTIPMTSVPNRALKRRFCMQP